MSLDGFIATKDDDLTWLSMVEQEGEDYGYADFIKTVDAYIVGRRTYEVLLKLTGGNFIPANMFDKCYVITRQQKEDEAGVIFYNGDVVKLIKQLKNEKGKHIYCDGGSEIIKLLLDENLIDEYIISVIPIILGDGIRLFKASIKPIGLKALPCKYFDSGLVQLHYIKA